MISWSYKRLELRREAWHRNTELQVISGLVGVGLMEMPDLVQEKYVEARESIAG